MNRRSSYRTALLGIMGAVALLVSTSVAGAHPRGALADVRAHVQSSDRMLDQAARLIRANRDRQATPLLARSTRELGLARAEAAKLASGADTEAEQVQAARARALVAAEQDERIGQLAAVVRTADGPLERRLVAQLRSDVRARDVSVESLTAMLERDYPAAAQAALAQAISKLTRDRDGEVAALSTALADRRTSPAARQALLAAVTQLVDGQMNLADRLARVAERVSPNARATLERTREAVLAEQERHADLLRAVAPRLPEELQRSIERVAEEADRNAAESGDGGRTETGTAPGTGTQPGTGTTPGGTPTGGTETGGSSGGGGTPTETTTTDTGAQPGAGTTTGGGTTTTGVKGIIASSEGDDGLPAWAIVLIAALLLGAGLLGLQRYRASHGQHA